jgi:hypothetical protein
MANLGGSEEDIRWAVGFSSLNEFLSVIRDKTSGPADFQQLFIPAGRSFFAYFQSNIFSLLNDNQTLDPFLIEFGSYYERIKNGVMPAFYIHNDSNAEDSVNELIQLILHGKHKREKKRDILVQNDGRKVHLENASSGQQEILPLAIILLFLGFFNLEKTSTTVYIEEPEAHLFPTAQRHIVELIATVFNTKPDKLQFVITTHSPYILTSFNNLMHAGFLAQKLKGKKIKQLNEIVPEQYQLQPDYVKSYAIKGGTQQNLVCPDSGLILGDIIDEVSNDLSVQFGDLLEVE